jgi:hypothetical protein
MKVVSDLRKNEKKKEKEREREKAREREWRVTNGNFL